MKVRQINVPFFKSITDDDGNEFMFDVRKVIAIGKSDFQAGYDGKVKRYNLNIHLGSDPNGVMCMQYKEKEKRDEAFNNLKFALMEANQNLYVEVEE